MREELALDLLSTDDVPQDVVQAAGDRFLRERTRFEAELSEKDLLIEALTQRLEQAAEQLDRLQRMGADRRVVSTSFGAAFQRDGGVTQDLQRFLEQWDTLQPAALAVHLQARLDAIEQTIQQGLDRIETAAVRGNVMGITSGNGLLNPIPGLDTSAFAGNDPECDTQRAAMWESLAEQFSESPAKPETVPLAGELEPDLEEPAQPPIIDPDSCEREELSQAIEQRDAYIGWLIRRLRARELAHFPTDWSSLNSETPVALQEIAELRRRLEEMLRLAEVELSVERAKLARDQARLRQASKPPAEEQMGHSASEPAGKSRHRGVDERRWQRFFGKEMPPTV